MKIACVIESDHDFIEATRLAAQRKIRIEDIEWWALSESAYSSVQHKGLSAIDICDRVDMDELKKESFWRSHALVRQFCEEGDMNSCLYRVASAISISYFLAQVFTYLGVAQWISDLNDREVLTLPAGGDIGTLRNGARIGRDGVFRRILSAKVHKNGYHKSPKDWCKLAWTQTKDWRRLCLPKSRVKKILGIERETGAPFPQADVVLDDIAGDFRRNFRMLDFLSQSSLSCLKMAIYTRLDDADTGPVSGSHYHIMHPEIQLTVSPYGCWKLLTAEVRASANSLIKIFNGYVAPQMQGLLDSQFGQLVYLCFVDAYYGKLRFDELSKRHRPRILLASDHDAPAHRMILLEANRAGVKTVSFTHGGGYIYVSPPGTYLADYALVNGEKVREFAIELGVAKNRLRVIGNRSLELLGKVSRSGTRNRKAKILVVLQGAVTWADPYSTGLLRRSLTELANGLSGRPEWESIIKAHPICNFQFFLQQLSESTGIDFTIDRWPREKFAEYDVAIFPGAMSVTLLELAALKVPVVFIDSALCDAERAIYRPDVNGCGVVADSVESALHAVSRILEDSAFREEVLKQSASYLKRFAEPIDGSEVLADTIQEILANVGPINQSDERV